jgi:hypothetical protein
MKTEETTEREDYFEFLDSLQTFKVVSWSIIARKRFYVFETLWNRGMNTHAGYKIANQMSYKKVRTFYKENHIKIK